MNFNPASLEALAQQFWAGAGLPDSFPRPIERAVSRRLPIAIVKLPEVTVLRIEEYLLRRGLPGELPNTADDLMGCLFAYRGHGIIFVCGADDPAEQRFTIGHDTAHFMLDYLRPRQMVVDALGQAALEVLDGMRPATHIERCAAVLRGVHVGPHLHLLLRQMPDSLVLAAEDSADALGLELMAPRSLIRSLAEQMSSYAPEQLCQILAEYFGLPTDVLRTALRVILPMQQPSFVDRAAAALGERWARSHSGSGGNDEP